MLPTLLKWGLPALALLVAASFATTKAFHVETLIPAPPEKVWAVLMDTDSYPEWNPVFVAVEGRYEEGAKLLNKVKDPGGNILEMTATVRTLKANRELRQTGGVPGLLTFDHSWQLMPVVGGTRVIQHEIDRGAGLWFWNSDWIEPAYGKAGDALRRRVMAEK